jgi:hypothetical protein
MLLVSSFELNQAANTVKGYALAVGIVFGIWVVWMWWRHKLAVDRVERQIRAKQAFARFVQQVLCSPELALAVGGMPCGQAPKYMQLLLTTIDEILLLDPTPEWRATLRRQLDPHADYLANTAFLDGVYGTLSSESKALVDMAMAAALQVQRLA